MKWILLIVPVLLVMAGFTYFSNKRTPPRAGEPAPDFVLPDQTGAPRRLSEYRGKWVVLYFYPKDDTPGCTAEACGFRDDWLAFKQHNAQVIGVSVDSPERHARFAQRYRLPFILLADPSGRAVRQYGALINLLGFKVAHRYTFLIDPKGLIHAAWLDVNPVRHAQEIISVLSRDRR